MNEDAYRAAQRMRQADQLAKNGTQLVMAGCFMFILPVVFILFVLGILMIVLGG